MRRRRTAANGEPTKAPPSSFAVSSLEASCSLEAVQAEKTADGAVATKELAVSRLEAVPGRYAVETEEATAPHA